MVELSLLDAEGVVSTIDLAPPPGYRRPTRPLSSRVAYAAAHVIPLAWADNTPGTPARIVQNVRTSRSTRTPALDAR